MRITYLYEFTQLASKLNFKETSDVLHISQSALSKHIQALEEDLGCALFERDRHHVMLTPQGEMFQIRAQAIVESYEGAKTAFASSMRSENRLVIGGIVDGPRCYEWIAKASENLTKRLPYFAPHFVPVSNTPPVMQAVKGETDCAIMAYFPEDYPQSVTDAVDFTHLADDPVYAIIDEAHPLAGRDAISASDMQDSRCARLVSPRTSSGWAAIARFLHHNGINFVTAEHHVFSTYDLVTLHLGEDVLLMPSHDIQWSLIVSSGKVIVPLDVPHPTLPVDIVYRKDKVSIVLQEFIKELQAIPLP